ncbi:hypothetical protein [Ethanoligenens sp.]|uniref:hypothetical protein n=1 Tax=Ethanoligenens sp. TaxID=2099655 RepID=UPI0039E8335F
MEIIPGVGMVFDAANGVWYASEGDWANAGFYAIAFIPIVGDITEVGKTAKDAVEIGKDVEKISEAAKDAEKVADANKLNHIFGKSEHNLDSLLGKYSGNETKAFNALETATQKYVGANNITGNFKDITVNVNGINVTVRGTVINGQVKIGTAFIP